MTEDVYLDMINQKTASLIATSCELGAITTSKTTQDRKATYEFGQNLGIAFQIKDDLFDLLGKESDTGKNSGGDVKKNMMTLPLIFSYSNMTKKENRKLKKLMGIKKKSRTVLKEIRGIVDESGGFDYARKKLDDFSNNALDAISFYPDSPVKKSLLDLVAFNVLRVK
jgi:octaprenyl-diphosphate synthase